MFFYSKKLVKCCKCGKQYSFDDNLYEHNGDYILQCPFCGLQHKVDISLLSKRYGDLKKIEKLDLATITMGSAAISRAAAISPTSNIVFINPASPATADGTITKVEVYCIWTAATTCVVGTVYETSDNVFSTRDYASVGNAAANAKTTYTKDSGDSDLALEVKAGDYIAFSCASGRNVCSDTSGGDGRWSNVNDGNNLPVTGVTFGFAANCILSLYAEGETSGGGEVTAGNPLFIFQNF